MKWYENSFFLLFFFLCLIFPPAVFSDSISVSFVVTGTAVYTFSGYAAPNSVVTFVENGVSVGTTTADATGVFTKDIEKEDEGSHTFSYYYADPKGNISPTLTETLSTTINNQVETANIITPPTIKLSESTVVTSDSFAISGYTIPNTTVSVTIHSDPITKTTTSDSNGLWSITVLASEISVGDHTVSATVTKDSATSSSSTELSLSISEASTPTSTPTPTPTSTSSSSGPTSTPTPTQVPTPTPTPKSILPLALLVFDLSGVGRIRIIDLPFVLRIWVDEWKNALAEELSPKGKTSLETGNKKCDINGDGECNLKDLSILLFYIER